MRFGVFRDRQQDAVALEDLAFVSVVNRRYFKVFQLDVAPYIELGPVAQREDPDLFALFDAAVVERPRLGTLRPGIPLAELVAETQDSFFGAGAFLVAAGTAERRVELAGLQGVKQRAGLRPVARCPAARVGYPTLVD